jgi:hypothetical protein
VGEWGGGLKGRKGEAEKRFSFGFASNATWGRYQEVAETLKTQQQA